MNISANILGVKELYFLNNYSNLLYSVYSFLGGNLPLNIDSITEKHYHDFNGWEFFLYHISSSIPSLHISCLLSDKLKIKHKSAKYQVRLIYDFFKLPTGKCSQEEVDLLVANRLKEIFL